MTEAGPLAEQIAASIEDVKALLDDNRSLSVAFLARRLRDHEELVRKLFLRHPCPCKTVQEVEASATKLTQRLDQARVKFQEMRTELDQLKINYARLARSKDGGCNDQQTHAGPTGSVPRP